MREITWPRVARISRAKKKPRPPLNKEKNPARTKLARIEKQVSQVLCHFFVYRLDSFRIHLAALLVCNYREVCFANPDCFCAGGGQPAEGGHHAALPERRQLLQQGCQEKKIYSIPYIYALPKKKNQEQQQFVNKLNFYS